MAKMDSESMQRYETLMKKDPYSKAFAPLADAYFENQQIDRAESLVRDGLRKHPEFPAGLVVYAKVLKARGQLQASLELLRKATRLSSDHILAHQLLADVLLELKKPQEALKAYKMVLFLNPKAPKALQMVQKLESLSALDFEEETFALTKLAPVTSLSKAQPLSEGETANETTKSSDMKGLQRMLSLIDAFIIRNDLVKASELLEESQREFGAHSEITRRLAVIRSRGLSSHLASQNAGDPSPLRPLASREKMIVQKKLETLRMLLRKIRTLSENELRN